MLRKALDGLHICVLLVNKLHEVLIKLLISTGLVIKSALTTMSSITHRLADGTFSIRIYLVDESFPGGIEFEYEISSR